MAANAKYKVKEMKRWHIPVYCGLRVRRVVLGRELHTGLHDSPSPSFFARCIVVTNYKYYCFYAFS